MELQNDKELNKETDQKMKTTLIYSTDNYLNNPYTKIDNEIFISDYVSLFSSKQDL